MLPVSSSWGMPQQQKEFEYSRKSWPPHHEITFSTSPSPQHSPQRSPQHHMKYSKHFLKLFQQRGFCPEDGLLQISLDSYLEFNMAEAVVSSSPSICIWFRIGLGCLGVSVCRVKRVTDFHIRRGLTERQTLWDRPVSLGYIRLFVWFYLLCCLVCSYMSKIGQLSVIDRHRAWRCMGNLLRRNNQRGNRRGAEPWFEILFVPSVTKKKVRFSRYIEFKCIVYIYLEDVTQILRHVITGGGGKPSTPLK